MSEAAAPKFDPLRHRRGGRPRKPPQERRVYRINLRLTPEEWAQGEARAAEAGLSITEYGRLLFTQTTLTIETAPVPPPETLRQLRLMGNSLRQAIAVVQAHGFTQQTQREIEEAARAVSTGLRTLIHGPEC